MILCKAHVKDNLFVRMSIEYLVDHSKARKDSRSTLFSISHSPLYMGNIDEIAVINPSLQKPCA